MIARRTLLAKLSLALFAAALPARVARAQDARPGRTTGRAFHPVPTGAMIEVSPLDDRPENLGIAAAFRAALARGGFAQGLARRALAMEPDQAEEMLLAGRRE